MQANSGRIIHHSGGTTFVGRDAVSIFRAFVIASALQLYARTGIKANRAYTPSAMLRVASEYLGHPFKRGQYQQAADELRAWAQQAREGMDVNAKDLKAPVEASEVSGFTSLRLPRRTEDERPA